MGVAAGLASAGKEKSTVTILSHKCRREVRGTCQPSVYSSLYAYLQNPTGA